MRQVLNIFILLWLILFSSSIYARPVVRIITVKAREVNPSKEYVGHVEAIRIVDVKPRVEGYLEQVRFREGDYVKEGEILYVIEQEPYRAEVDAARAALKEAEAHFYKASQRLKRLKAASPESISKTDMDDAIADVMLARAEIMQAKASLRRAKIDLGYTVIKAPISGVIGKSFIKKGNLVGPTTSAMCRIIQMDPIRVVYSVSERDMDQIRWSSKHLLKVKIKLPNGKISPLYGKIDFVDNHVDPDTGTLAVWAVFPNPDRMLLPGMYVTAIPILKRAKRVIMIPQRTVLEDKKGTYVLLVNRDKRVEIRRIKIGNMRGTEWEVLSGISEGDRIIVQGILKVRPGQLVNVQR